MKVQTTNNISIREKCEERKNCDGVKKGRKKKKKAQTNSNTE